MKVHQFSGCFPQSQWMSRCCVMVTGQGMCQEKKCSLGPSHWLSSFRPLAAAALEKVKIVIFVKKEAATPPLPSYPFLFPCPVRFSASSSSFFLLRVGLILGSHAGLLTVVGEHPSAILLSQFARQNYNASFFFPCLILCGEF